MTLSTFDEIAKYLEQHEHSKRIKKLIFCVCKNTWENDQATLDTFKFKALIEELYHLNPTIDNLNFSLFSVVDTLNKREEYSMIASIITNEIQKLYLILSAKTGIIPQPPNQEEETGIILNKPHNSILSNSEKILSNAINNPANITKKHQYNSFDLRQNIMKYTNPLRAKIILFSALYHKFTFNKQDWFKLRAETLDTLLQKLFDSCPTIREFEYKVNTAVMSLGNPDENTQTGSTLIQHIRRLYSEMPAPDQPNYSNSSQETITIVNHNYQIDLNEIDDFRDNSDNNSTCQIVVPSTQQQQ
jgi:hypothetical protein